MFVQAILGTVCLYRLYWGQCVCTGYTRDSVFVQVILGTVCLYRLYWGQLDTLHHTNYYLTLPQQYLSIRSSSQDLFNGLV